MSLFAHEEQQRLEQAQPLAARMRPRRLDEFVGQEHFLGPGQLLRRLLRADRLGSLLFTGPPGTGKTTLARLISAETRSRFHAISAVTSGVKELREVLNRATDELRAGGPRTLLFVDEIHRFNRAQQDVLLHDVEEGTVTLIGATTANPFFTVNAALISRSQLFQFQPLTVAELVCLLQRALTDRERGLGEAAVEIESGALEYLAAQSDGDARRALNTLELAVRGSDARPLPLSRQLLAESMQRRTIVFDPTGDEHYDLASALIKSVRGSDPDASLYWLARLLESGEEVRFISRRLVILASEDIGNADPQALLLAVAAMQACEFIGLPECQLTLAHAVTYLACAPKSNAATQGLAAAMDDVRRQQRRPVPAALRDSHYAAAAAQGRGVGYISPHEVPEGVVPMDYMGAVCDYYRPVERGFESDLSERLRILRATLRSTARAEVDDF